MPVKYKLYKGIPMIEIKGNFDLTNSHDIKEKLNHLLSENSISDIILDLTNLKFVDSSAIGVIVKLALKLKESQGRIVIVNTSQNIKKLFTMSNLNSIVNIVENFDIAVSSFSKV